MSIVLGSREMPQDVYDDLFRGLLTFTLLTWVFKLERYSSRLIYNKNTVIAALMIVVYKMNVKTSMRLKWTNNVHTELIESLATDIAGTYEKKKQQKERLDKILQGFQHMPQTTGWNIGRKMEGTAGGKDDTFRKK